ncbi:MAG: C4-type zinc ribbon domain-containing protein [Syntrophales bacterium]|nr:C4-type zinc ribbon domain-containing protein [Syntrophales bacterium]
MNVLLPLLIELQKMDTQIVRANAKRKELPAALARLDENFRVLEAEMTAARNRQESLVKKHRELEERLKKAVEGLKRTKDRLTEVKTNKEYQACLKEIETLEQKNGELEEEILGVLEEIDAGREALKKEEETFLVRKGEYEKERARLQREMEVLGTDLQKLVERGEDLRRQIPEHLLRKYEQIKAINNGIAVVSVWKEICGGCHMNIPPQLYIELRETDEIVLCPHCNRIIFWYDRSAENG